MRFFAILNLLQINQTNNLIQSFFRVVVFGFRRVTMAKVLIVDDSSFARIKLKQLLQKNGFEVVGEAENGKIALEKSVN